MNELNINQNWTFKEAVLNIEALKSQIWDILASFSCFEQKEKTLFMHNLKKTIFSFSFDYWKRERIFEYIYNDFTIEELKKLK